MRILAALLVIAAVTSCGPETVRATGAPVTAAPAATTPASTTPPATRTPAATATPNVTATTSTSPAASATPLATAAPGPSASPAETPVLGSCASELALRSQPSSGTAPLLLVNNAGARRDLLSLDANGKRVFAKSLGSGESYTQTTRVGEVWLVADPGGGCVAIYRVVAPALLIVATARNSLIPLYAIRGRVTDARSGAPLPGQTMFVWQPDEASCAIIGGSGAPGYVVSSITAPDGTYGVYVTVGDYKVRVRTAAVTGVNYAPQWWRGKPASTAGQCAAADVITLNADLLAIDFALQPE